jgi:hypothetical protein
MEANYLLDLVMRKIRLNRAGAPAGAAAATRPATRVGNATPAARPPMATTTPAGAANERRLLSVEDVNLIRQQELKPNDAGVRLTFQGDVKRRYAAAHNMSFAEFNRLPPVQQALAIIENGTVDMRRQVRVASDPSSLAEYKRAVQPVVLSGCATSACHGGPGGAGLVLFSPADTDPLAYTNFYILQKYTKQMPPPLPALGPVTARLIDRGHGEDSLLVNFGLPASLAVYDHPLVGGKPLPTAVFRNKEEARYQQVVRWMNETLRTIEPNYGIDYEIPGTAAARATPAAPATAPATTQPAGNE